MSSMGMTWAAVSVSPGEDSKLAASVEDAHAQGLRLLVIARGDRAKGTDETYKSDFLKMLGDVAQGGADAIEVWPEGNIAADMNGKTFTPEQYTAFLCDAKKTISGANTKTLVIGGAPIPTGYSEGCKGQACSDNEWLTAIVAAGGLDCMDMQGVGYYSGATEPSATKGHPISDHYSFYFEPLLKLYADIIQGKRPLAITGFGYFVGEGNKLPSGFDWAAKTTRDDETKWTVKAVQIASQDNIKMMILNLTSSSDPISTSLLLSDGSCPACTALSQALTQP